MKLLLQSSYRLLFYPKMRFLTTGLVLTGISLGGVDAVDPWKKGDADELRKEWSTADHKPLMAESWEYLADTMEKSFIRGKEWYESFAGEVSTLNPNSKIAANVRRDFNEIYTDIQAAHVWFIETARELGGLKAGTTSLMGDGVEGWRLNGHALSAKIDSLSKEITAQTASIAEWDAKIAAETSGMEALQKDHEKAYPSGKLAYEETLKNYAQEKAKAEQIKTTLEERLKSWKEHFNDYFATKSFSSMLSAGLPYRWNAIFVSSQKAALGYAVDSSDAMKARLDAITFQGDEPALSALWCAWQVVEGVGDTRVFSDPTHGLLVEKMAPEEKGALEKVHKFFSKYTELLSSDFDKMIGSKEPKKKRQ